MITKLPRASASERSEIAKSSYLTVCELQFPSAKKTGESVRAPMTPHAMNFPPDDETYLPLELENHHRSLRAAHLTSPFRRRRFLFSSTREGLAEIVTSSTGNRTLPLTLPDLRRWCRSAVRATLVSSFPFFTFLPSSKCEFSRAHSTFRRERLWTSKSCLYVVLNTSVRAGGHASARHGADSDSALCGTANGSPQGPLTLARIRASQPATAATVVAAIRPPTRRCNPRSMSS